MVSTSSDASAHELYAQLVTQLEVLAPAEGVNPTPWPGLIAYRFSSPVRPTWNKVTGLSLGFVVQGRKRVIIDSRTLDYEPGRYLLLTRGAQFTAEIIEASESEPFLSLLVQVEPDLIRTISGELTLAGAVRPRDTMPAAGYVEECDRRLCEALLRMVETLHSPVDRQVLTPGRLREVVYRVLLSNSHADAIHAAINDRGEGPVPTAIAYIDAHIGEPLTVADLAVQVRMSTSAFAHVFREAVGIAPYQYVKRTRLERARLLIVKDGLSAGEACRQVGYTSLSHFINDFRRQFDVTPGALAAQHMAVPASAR